MNKKRMQEVNSLLLDFDISELNELIRYIEHEKAEREAHELQHESEVQEYLASQDNCSEEV